MTKLICYFVELENCRYLYRGCEKYM